MIESKPFYRKIEAAFAGVGETHSPRRFAAQLAPRLLQQLGGALGVTAVQLYERSAGKLVQAGTWGERFPDLSQELMERFEPIGDSAIAEVPWAGDTAAGRVGLLPIGDHGEGPLLAMFIARAGDLRAVPTRTELVSALASLRYAVDQRLRENELEDLFEQARAVQLSLLPSGRPSFADYDICAVSLPAQSVGGDLYDFIEVDADTLGVAVADASGHGLPAALQARDVVTGLRMGVERDLKITRMIEKLNRVIHRSGLSSRFVSLVFGELERNGNFSYINAGHPAPLLRDARGIAELSVGGMILGPDPAALYKLGFAHLDRGASMVLYSDGVIEHAIEDEREFGIEGLRAWLEAWPDGPADAAVNDLLARLRAQSDGAPFEDDVTIVMVRRPR